MKKISVGILAHVDAGKTTLNESILYHAGIIRKTGRVDHGDSFMDYDSQEKDRGITIYSKTARISWNDAVFYLIDTPGHVDFSSEMERTLEVLDCLVLVISGLDGVQSHTETIYRLAERYDLPVFTFVNKMDISYFSQEELMDNLNKHLKGNFVNFSDFNEEAIAMADYDLLEEYGNTGKIKTSSISAKITGRKLVPVYFGSALKDEGVTELLDALEKYLPERKYDPDFGAYIFKVFYDETATRLCYLKITGGQLVTKQSIDDDNKVDQIRQMNGQKFTLINTAEAGDVVCVKGFATLQAGQGIGSCKDTFDSTLDSYMNYRVIPQQGSDLNLLNRQLNMLMQEDATIKVRHGKTPGDIHISLMGEIQKEVIRQKIMDRCGISITFGEGEVLYKETIASPVIGYGHFEPLRHYSEVHLLMSPLPSGKGIKINSALSRDVLNAAWQSQIINALKQKEHVGVLTGSPLTDVEITLIAGRGHLKHTEGGDFRQAALRAVRQGLMMADNVLLEPFFSFEITCPQNSVGSLVYELETRLASYSVESLNEESAMVLGRAPVKLLQNFQAVLASITSGKGRIVTSLAGYFPCHDSEEVISNSLYEPEADDENPTGSVFCSHGSSYYVPYDYVMDYMHIKDDYLEEEEEYYSAPVQSVSRISEKELARVVANINGANRNKNKVRRQVEEPEKTNKKPRPMVRKPQMLIADGYNLMYGWEKTKGLAGGNMETARDIVINDLINYKGYKNCELIIVFDAYKVREGQTHSSGNKGVTIVYTRQGETADSHIEKLVHDNIKKYDILVATSDRAVQDMVLGTGARRISAREIELELDYLRKANLDNYR